MTFSPIKREVSVFLGTFFNETLVEWYFSERASERGYREKRGLDYSLQLEMIIVRTDRIVES